ncbi:hypothetical protein NDU88_004523 [Pleurodeles waltl]|uniref:Uncharacterized protein n=1 Tax=Pleurodeles waltl TaxID=8319 RepID=A0AAV7PG20_PLEWA|nr:hypothetical protein NDU88_004523 [Pleurodeles waltl]
MVGYSEDCCHCTFRPLALPCDCCALRAGFNGITTAANGFVRSPAVPITERCSLLAQTSPRPATGEGALSSVRLRERPGLDPRAVEPCGAASHVSRARMSFLAGPRLLDWASCPPHLQFNKFVLTGYRPEASGGECVRSLFYLHNELGNIYTHGEDSGARARELALGSLFKLLGVFQAGLTTAIVSISFVFCIIIEGVFERLRVVVGVPVFFQVQGGNVLMSAIRGVPFGKTRHIY